MSSNTLFQSPGTISMDQLNGDFTPEHLYDLDADNSFDFDNADLGGEMIGALPDDLDADGLSEHHEKRKSLDEDAEEGDAKRQETQEGKRGAKKPGRKPLTSEPTTKRKAQNRAAQRAFRERKEKHLKDLETKVSELTKTQEADKHENGLLKAQVERLQVELKDYRKRLSLNSGGPSRSPPLAARNGTPNRNSTNFQFDFPRFGSLPSGVGPMLVNDGAVSTSSAGTPPASANNNSNNTTTPITGSYNNPSRQLNRHNSEGQSMSPRTQTQYSASGSPAQLPNIDPVTSNTTFAPYSTNDNMHGFASTLPQMGKSSNDLFGDLFSPSILKSVGQSGGADGSYFASPQQSDNSIDDNTNNININNSTGITPSYTNPSVHSSSGGDSTAGIPDHRVFRFNSGSNASDTASPSASSLSQWNNNTANSSCGTSPEPSTESPAIKDKSNDSFGQKLINNPGYSFTQLPAQTPSTNLSLGDLAHDNYNLPQVDAFDPVLFGDFRDSNDNVVGNGDFNGGFFDDAINSAPFDMGSPSNLFGILADYPSAGKNPVDAPTPSRNLMAEIEKTRDGVDDDFGLPDSQQPKKMDANGKLISCTKIWSQLQSNPDFQDGKFDLDGLCSELRSKARCSESGLMVESSHVDAALKKLHKLG